MMEPSEPTTAQLHKHACTLCAKRKVKCDRTYPCANCARMKVQCVYQAPESHRQRKRPNDDDLIRRLGVYEDLMRKHNVDFSHADDVWIPSGLEAKKETGVHGPIPLPPLMVTETNFESSRDLWSTLNPELKSPPTQGFQGERSSHISDFTIPLESVCPRKSLVGEHPEPRHIFRLWQIFVERVNPLTKAIHVPTLQQQIMDASWNLQAVPKPTEAVMFAIYTLAVGTLSTAESRTLFDEDKMVLWRRYRIASMQALIAADLLSTKDFEVLQAFFLFLIAEIESDFSSTLSALAVRIAQRMGVYNSNPPESLPFFQQEMRVRLSWQIRALTALHTWSIAPFQERAEMRMPLNVNDSDLHPNMAGPPVEHVGPTEMIQVLMKYEVAHWTRTSHVMTKLFQGKSRDVVHGAQNVEQKLGAIAEIEDIYNKKYLHLADPKIPLHDLAITMARLAVARMRFMIYHPRRCALLDSNMVFENALVVLEGSEKCRRLPFATHLLVHMSTRSQVDAFVYILSELRRRCIGDRVEDAWRAIEAIYSRHQEFIENEDSSFYSALRDLTLEAWDARQMELVRVNGAWNATVPEYIQTLKSRRSKLSGEAVVAAVAVDESTMNMLLNADNSFNWDYWGDILQG